MRFADGGYSQIEDALGGVFAQYVETERSYMKAPGDWDERAKGRELASLIAWLWLLTPETMTMSFA